MYSSKLPDPADCPQSKECAENNDVNVFSTLKLQGDGYFSLVALVKWGLAL